MTDSFGLQASFTIPSGEQYEKGDMVNIRGANPQEFHANLLAFDEQIAQLVANVGNNLRAVAAAAKGLGGQQISHDSAQQPNQPAQYQTQQAPGAPQNAPEWAQNGQQGQGGGYQQQQAPDHSQGQQGYQSPYGAGQGQQGYQQGPPQGQQQPPQGNGVPTEPPPHVGPAPQCSHGTKRFIAKPYKGGKPGFWMAWACPAQQGDQSQHDLEFIRNS